MFQHKPVTPSGSLGIVPRLFLSGLLVLSAGARVAIGSPEKIPPYRLVRPSIGNGSPPVLLIESRQDPEFPEAPRRLNLRAELILQVLIDAAGKVVKVSPIQTTVWERLACTPIPKDSHDKDPKKEDLYQKASKQFEESAVTAIKHWKFQPGTIHGVPASSYHLVVVNFDPCVKTK